MSDVTFPGDKIALIEEYEAGRNTFDDGHMVRSAVVGTPDLNKKDRTAHVQNFKQLSVPNVNDIVIGTVAAVMSSMIAVMILYVNGKPVKSHVECICNTRNIRKKAVALVNDVIKLKIISHLNGTIHATISEPQLGVLFTKCRKCGGRVIPMQDAIKCVECAWIDERKLSTDFGNYDFLKMRE